jgi:hypothetical protein
MAAHLYSQLVYHIISLVGQQVHYPLVRWQLLKAEQGRWLGRHGVSHGRGHARGEDLHSDSNQQVYSTQSLDWPAA